MKMKQWSIVILMLVLLAQGACSSSPATATADACPTPTSETTLLTNSDDGYCLLYPSEFSTSIPDYIVINPVSGPGDIPGDAWVWIDVQDAAGRTAAQAADIEITELGPGFNITRMDVSVGGEEAVVVDGIPAQDSLRRVFIVHGERLYRLSFMPWQPNADSAGQLALEELYTMILETLHFLPQG